jgi:phenylacetate-CoA ligase
MNKQYLKKIRDLLPESIKILFGTYFRNRIIKNHIYLKTLSNLKNSDKNSPQINNILEHAYNTVPYYNNLIRKRNEKLNIEDFQIINKEIICENFENFISNTNENYYEAYTGGSTGKPLKLYLDYNHVFFENAFIDYFRSKIGYNYKTDKIATFRGVEFGEKISKINPSHNELILSPFKLNSDTIHVYLKNIDKFKPSFINGYLSAIYVFTKMLKDNNLKLLNPIKGIFLISESINENQRNFIESFFKVKSITFYGHTERCVIAEEINRNEYKFHNLYGLTELIPDEEFEGAYRIVSTGLFNKKMPLIRYMTDDICYPLENGLFKIIGKRKSTEGIYGRNGEFFSQAAFNIHSNAMKNVIQYQFHQKIQGKVELHIIPSKNYNETDKENILTEINKKMKGIVEFEIIVKDKLKLSIRGKFNIIISEL